MSLDELSIEQRNAIDEWRHLAVQLLAAETKLFYKQHPDILLNWELIMDPTTRNVSLREKQEELS